MSKFFKLNPVARLAALAAAVGLGNAMRSMAGMAPKLHVGGAYGGSKKPAGSIEPHAKGGKRHRSMYFAPTCEVFYRMNPEAFLKYADEARASRVRRAVVA